MSDSKAANKAGDTKTTGREYVKRESGEQHVPQVPAENMGHTSPNCDDLENPEQDTGKPHPADKTVADKIKQTNDQI